MKKTMKLLRAAAGVALLVCGGFSGGAAEPIKALLITGGGSHDYEQQKNILTKGISARANVTWTIVDEAEGDKDVKTHEVSVYNKPDWSKGYDIVVHDECFGQVTNADFVEKIAKGHAGGIPAVVLHCTIHAYRFAKTDEWRQVLGVSSFRHQAARAFKVVNLKPDDPIMKDFPAEWQDYPDELYEIVKLWPNCVPLAKGLGVKDSEHPCVWKNTYHGARVFGTTLGHSNKTVGDAVYLDLVTRGLLWACGKLDDDGKPAAGYGPSK
jgi:type 1 glutamine amidotransferase